MKYILLACFALISTSYKCYSQLEKIQTDRPGKALTPHLTRKGWFQPEIGFEKEQRNKDDYSLQHPEFLIKYGLLKWLEVRTEMTAETEKQYSLNEFNYGLKPLEVGIKAMLFEAKGALPSISVYTQVGLPHIASKDHQANTATTELRLLFENKLTDNFHLNYNAGIVWDGENPQHTWLYTVDQEIDLGKKWEVFVELFGYFAKGQPAQHNADGGLAYLLNKNFKFDMSAGVGLSKESPDYFISTGLAFRLR